MSQENTNIHLFSSHLHIMETLHTFSLHTLDVNECAQANLCDHNCNNTEGSYTCSCDGGYTLSENGYTCNGKVACMYCC